MAARRSLKPLLLTLAALLLAFWGQHELRAGVNPLDGLLLHGAAALLFAGALSRAGLPSPNPASGPKGRPFLALLMGNRSFSLEAFGVLLLFLAALAVRLWRLDSIPWGVWFDEAQNALEAQRILEDPAYRPLFLTTLPNLPALFFYGFALAQRFLGETILAMRLLPALGGALAVPAFYWLLRELLGPRLALAGGLLLAFSRWEITFSRVAFHSIFTVLLGVAAMLFLIRGLRTGRLIPFVASGAALGLGFHGYYASLLMPAVVVLYAAHWAFLQRGRLDSPRLRGIGVLALVAALLYAPLAWFALEHPDLYTHRLQEVSLLKNKGLPEAAAALGRNVEKHLVMFHWRGDNNGRHNLPGEPMLDDGTAVLLTLGLGYALVHWRRPFAFLGLLWVGVLLLPGILSLEFEAPQAHRSIGVIPGLSLLAVLALGGLGRAWALAFGPARSGIFGVLAGLGLLWIAGTNLDLYFQRQMTNASVWSFHSGPETQAARFLQALPDPAADLYISPLLHNHPTILFLAPQAGRARVFQLQQDVPLSRTLQGGAVYLLESNFAFLLPLLREIYPDGQFLEQRDPAGKLSFVSGVVPAAALAATRGLQVTYYLGVAAEGQPLLERTEPRLPEGEPSPLRALIQWRGQLQIPRYGRYSFRLESQGPASLWIDGGEILASPGVPRENTLFLAEGLHSLRLRSEVGESSLYPRLLWRRPGGPWEAVPAHLLYLPQVPRAGLLGRYYANDAWAGEPAIQRLDPGVFFYFHHNPLPRPYSIEWQGKLLVPETGSYRLATESLDGSWLYLDGSLVVDNGAGTGAYRETRLDLTAGWYHLRLRYVDRRDYPKIYLYWTPPAGQRQPLPPRYLFPPDDLSANEEP